MTNNRSKSKNRFFCLFAILIMMLLGVTAYAQDARPRLGLSVSPLQASPILLQHLRLAEGEGLTVENIAVGGELEAAGLSQGDIVIAIDGKQLTRPSELTEYLKSRPQGSQVTLDVIQKGDHRQIYVKLDSLPDEIVWKYSRPVAGPGRHGFGSQGHQSIQINPFSMQIPQNSRSGQNAAPGSNGSAQISARSVFKSIINTDEGTKTSTVIISGPQNDPATEIEITVGDDNWKTTIGEIDNLPETARTAAQNAIRQSGSFSFSFGSGGGDDFFEEMIRRQQEQMQRIDEMFRRQMQPMPQGNDPQNDQIDIPRAEIDIRS